MYGSEEGVGGPSCMAERRAWVALVVWLWGWGNWPAIMLQKKGLIACYPSSPHIFVYV